MKILFAPSNTASFSSSLSSALKTMKGVEVKGFSIGRNKYVSYPEEWRVVQYVAWKKNPLRRLFQQLYVNYKLIHLILWADVLYWQWGINGFTFFDIHKWLIKLLKKPMLVEWVGSDIRVPEFVEAYNRFYREARESDQYEYRFESAERSFALQKSFKKLNAVPVVCPEMSLFVDRALFPVTNIVNCRIDPGAFSCSTKRIGARPVIVHAPSATGAKGTLYVRLAIESLKKKNLDFDYREITNVSRGESVAMIHESDIFLDQFVLGSYGMAATEAMAMGKVVVGYIMEPVRQLLPAECPVVNVPGDQLANKLEELISQPNVITEIGRLSRSYVEKYHDARKIAKEVFVICEDLLMRHREKTNQAISV